MSRRTVILLILPLVIILSVLALGQTSKVREILYYHWGLKGIKEIYKLRFSLLPKGRDVFFEGDGLRIAGTIFSLNDEKAPGVVFLHGSSIYGRKLGFCLLLCDRLARKGFHVLSMDMRGFGDSDDPALIDNPESWQSRGDIAHAISFLIESSNVDSNALYMVGHSAGANQAIIAGIDDNRIKKIVAIGPSRRVQERVLSGSMRQRQYFVERFSKDRKLNQILSWETYRQVSVNAMMDSHLGYFQQQGHKPILLIDGSLEDRADQVFLQNIYEKLLPPKKYVTIHGGNHYSDAKTLGPILLYNRRVFDDLVQAIALWLKE